MHFLFPIIRRKRRPLLPVESAPPVEFTPIVQHAPPVTPTEPPTAKATEPSRLNLQPGARTLLSANKDARGTKADKSGRAPGTSATPPPIVNPA